MDCGLVCVVTDSAWISGRIHREASCRVLRAPAEIDEGGVVASVGRLKLLSYRLLIGDVPHGVAAVCENLGSSQWPERTFVSVYVRRQGVSKGRFYADGALRAEDSEGGDEAWRAFSGMCKRVGIDCSGAVGLMSMKETA